MHLFRKLFADSDSEEEFEVFSESDLPENDRDLGTDSGSEPELADQNNNNVNVSKAYHHPWLTELDRGVAGPKNILDDPEEWDIVISVSTYRSDLPMTP